ncbi:N-terminal binuclear Zn cluster-containing/DNA binding domain-containing protein [Xylogone sp. PMI_703]|nr:N-terminal binuclear Zn cluster-containing/DNA binding domain-containing protein [Xylogone sp. PMI_703]
MSPASARASIADASEQEQQQQQQQKPKRRRIGYACDQCRSKKNRCDGERPSCGPCGLRRIPCVYSAQKPRATFTQEYVDGLKARNIVLERQLAAQNRLSQDTYNSSLPDDVHASPSVHTPFPGSVTSNPTPTLASSRTYPQFASPLPNDGFAQNPELPQARRLSTLGSDRPNPSSGSPDDTIECEGRTPANLPTMSEEINPTHGVQNSTEYFGESSTFDFMTKVCSPADTSKGQSDTQPKRGPASVDTSLAMSTPSTHMYSGIALNRGNDDEFGLPHRFVADKLVDAYFAYRHPLNPYLHEPSFRQRYERLWLSEEFGGEAATEDNLGWFGLINMVFCFGSDHAKALGRVPIDRIRFFKRAKALVFSGLLQPSRIELVQALLLMGQYLHGSLDLNTCWTVVGLAIRMAQGLGLHLDPTGFTPEIIEQEIRKRVWWGCFVIDRILSMKVGRPPTIHDDSNIKVGLPIIIDDEYLTNDKNNPPVQPPDTPSKLDFLLQVIPLCRLIDRIRDTLYSGGQVDLSKQKLTDIPKILSLSTELDGDLVAWQKRLPPHLRSNSQLPEWHFERQRSTLFMRFLNARLLLHRQILLIYVTCFVKDDFQREVMHCSVRRCIIAAHETVCQVRLLHEKRFFHYWWHHSHFIFAALGVMLAFKMLDPQRKEDARLPDSIDVDQAIIDGKGLLEEVGSHLHPLASRYLQSYQRLEVRLQEMAAERENEVNLPRRPQQGDTQSSDVAGRGESVGDQYFSPDGDGSGIFYKPTDELTMLLDNDFSEFENIFNGTGWSGLISDWNEA